LGELRKADYALLFNALRYFWRGNLRIQDKANDDDFAEPQLDKAPDAKFVPTW
jgi:hypothetical protein